MSDFCVLFCGKARLLGFLFCVLLFYGDLLFGIFCFLIMCKKNPQRKLRI